MLLARTVYKFIFPLIITLGLAACSSTVPPVASQYNSKYHFNQEATLPPDYPTKYLPNGDLWNDLRDDLQLADYAQSPAVKAQIRFYQNHQAFLDRTIVRGAPYLYYIYQQSKKYHLPAEVVLIPIGESGFVPAGTSYRGAVGIWQFMPSTAHGFGLKMNSWYDGRRDVIASTDAALKYFAYLYYYFDSNWLLAIAAYDTGPGNVQLAMLRNQRHNLPTDFWSLKLATETRVYIPRLLALAAIVKNPNKYGMHLIAVNDAPYFAEVNVNRQIDFNKVAKYASSTPSIIRSLNPAYLRASTGPGGPYNILIPKSKLDTFTKNLSSPTPLFAANTTTTATPTTTTTSDTASHPASDDQSIDNTETTQTASKWSKHKVARGETLIAIARNYHTSATALRRINKLHSDRVHPQQLLLVPHTSEKEPNQENVQETNDNIVDTNTTLADNSAYSSTKNNQTTNTTTYTVAKGDTILSIARKYKTSPAKIRALNNLKSNSIHVGTDLQLVGSTSSPSLKKSNTTPTLAATKTAKETVIKSTKKIASNSKHTKLAKNSTHTHSRTNTSKYASAHSTIKRQNAGA